MRLSTRYNQLVTRRRWAVNTIARMVRGWIVRRRVKTTVEALYDTGKRQLAKMKEDWTNARRHRASVRIQMAYRKMSFNVKVNTSTTMTSITITTTNTTTTTTNTTTTKGNKTINVTT